MEPNNDNHKLACESAAVGAGHEGTVPATEGTCPSIKTEQAGKLSRIPHFQRLEARRRQPGNCHRYGKPNGNGYANCEPCRQYQARYRARKRAKPILMDGRTWNAILRRLASLELSVARLQLDKRDAYKRGYQTAQKHERKLSVYEPPTMSLQEIATLNHAYAPAH